MRSAVTKAMGRGEPAPQTLMIADEQNRAATDHPAPTINAASDKPPRHRNAAIVVVIAPPAPNDPPPVATCRKITALRAPGAGIQVAVTARRS